jgi:uncharacterized protein involved in propanediol utilization
VVDALRPVQVYEVTSAPNDIVAIVVNDALVLRSSLNESSSVALSVHVKPTDPEDIVVAFKLLV